VSQQPSGEHPGRIDRLFFRALMLVFLGVFLIVLQDRLSPVLVGASLFLLVFLNRRGIRFETGVGLVAGLLFGAWFVGEVGSLLWPFLISFVLAYLLAPLVKILDKWISRTLAIGIIAILMLGLLTGIGVVLVPKVIEEVVQFVGHLPAYGNAVQRLFEELLTTLRSVGIDVSVVSVKMWLVERLPQLGRLFAAQMTSALKNVTSGVAALLNLLMIPFVTFYVLKDYEKIQNALTSVMPRRHLDTTLSLVNRVDSVLGQYIRGQVLVCSFIAALTATGLTISGVPYAVLLGVTAGLLNLIPYVGLAISFGITSVVALLGGDALFTWLKVLAVFAVVQSIEGNFLSPRVVGRRVGLHPAWVMFALVISGHFWGFLGLLLAIPVAAVINIIAKIVADRYYNSRYYGLD
jgi:predicted PurR-regulated permease PerM